MNGSLADARTQPAESNAPAHTPGPWEHVATDPNDGWDGFRIVGLGRQHEWGDIASVTGPQSNLSSVADARLIAAAPDLLSAAVAMVKGEDDLIAELIADGDDPVKYGMPFPLVDALRAAIAKATSANSVGMEPLQAAECAKDNTKEMGHE